MLSPPMQAAIARADLFPLANLRANPQAARDVWSADPKLCVPIKGDIALHTKGRDWQTMKVRADNPDLPARTLASLAARAALMHRPSNPPIRMPPPSRTLTPSIASPGRRQNASPTP